MTTFETQRRPVPLADGGELDIALAFLAFARECVVKKTEGLAEEQLRRVLVPTGTNLLGLVQHLTASERYWFGYHLAGLAEYEDVDFDMAVPADVPAERVLADYRRACADSDAAIRAAGGPDAPTATPVVRGEPRSLRWVLAHMTSETARHAGHADILREQLDGTTGR
ncbi:DinB family protein [Kitasatospora cineracea]